jgi:hypothetical protein
MTERRIIGICTDYLGFIAALRDRAADLGLAMGSENAAEISGLAGATLARLMTPKTSGKILSIESFGVVLGLLGVKVLVIEDEGQTRRMEPRIVKRNIGYVRDGSVHFSFSRKELKEMQRKGGANSRKGMSPKKASALGRKAALIRHSGGPASIRSYNARAAALVRWTKHRGERDGSADHLEARAPAPDGAPRQP